MINGLLAMSDCLATLKCTATNCLYSNVGKVRNLKAFVVFSTASEKKIQPDFPRDKDSQRGLHRHRLVDAWGKIMI